MWRKKETTKRKIDRAGLCQQQLPDCLCHKNVARDTAAKEPAQGAATIKVGGDILRSVVGAPGKLPKAPYATACPRRTQCLVTLKLHFMRTWCMVLVHGARSRCPVPSGQSAPGAPSVPSSKCLPCTQDFLLHPVHSVAGAQCSMTLKLGSSRAPCLVPRPVDKTLTDVSFSTNLDFVSEPEHVLCCVPEACPESQDFRVAPVLLRFWIGTSW